MVPGRRRASLGNFSVICLMSACQRGQFWILALWVTSSHAQVSTFYLPTPLGNWEGNNLRGEENRSVNDFLASITCSDRAPSNPRLSHVDTATHEGIPRWGVRPVELLRERADHESERVVRSETEKKKRIRVWICLLAHTTGIPAFLFEDQTADPCAAESRSCSSLAPRFDPGRISGFWGFWRQEAEGSYLLGVVQDPCLMGDCPPGYPITKTSSLLFLVG